MKIFFLFVSVFLFLFLSNSYSQETFYLNRNNDTIRFQKSNYYYLEFKKTVDSTAQDSIAYIMYNQIDTLVGFDNNFGKIRVLNDSLVSILYSLSDNFTYISPELYKDTNNFFFLDNAIFAKIKNGISIETVLNNYNVEYSNIEKFEVVVGLYYIKLNNVSDIFNIIHTLYNSGNFEYVEPSFNSFNNLTSTLNTTDYNTNPDFQDQWWLQDNTNANIHIQDAWEVTAGNPNIKIGVLDTGVDFTLNDLNDNCEHGYNADETSSFPPIHGYGSPDSEYFVTKMHGTGIASIIAAENNNQNVLGIAYESTIYPIRIAGTKMVPMLNVINPTIQTKEIHPGDHNEYVFVPTVFINRYAVLQGLNNAFQKNLDIINCSFSLGTESGPLSDAIFDALDNLANNGRNGKGTVIVFSAGNNGAYEYINPIAGLENVICVGGVTPCGLRCRDIDSCNNLPVRYYSNFGQELDVMAPGINFIGLWAESNITNSLGSGTSYAAPIVAGIASLILSVNPCLSSSEVREIIEKTATKTHPEEYPYTNTPNHPNGLWNVEVGYGIVNAYEAVMMAIDYANKGYMYTGDVSITGNVNWTSDFYTLKDLYVEQGSVLTISSTISFAPGRSLRIAIGGKVIIDGGELTSLCSNSPWEGVIVEGINGNTQSGVNPYQGYFVLNNSTISNAKCGITVGIENDQFNAYTGGIVIANNTNFINNEIGVKFLPYSYYSGQIEVKNRSMFTNCTFTVNSEFLSSEMQFKSHVELYEVNGILFKACKFESINYNSSNNEDEYSGVGILSYNSGFTVKPSCSAILLAGEACDEQDVTVASIFYGLNYGIIATCSENISKIEILSNDFTNNDIGVYISGCTNPSILKNRFSIGKSIFPTTDSPIGLKINNSTGFRIEENRFIKNGENTNKQIGIYLKNSGADNNKIYKNYFENLNIGQYLEGINYSTLNNCNGLVTLCNTNSSNHEADIIVGYDIEQRYNGINLYQSGSNAASSQILTAAGNVFSLPANIDIQYLNYTGRIINYYFYDTQTNLAKPTEYFDILPFAAPGNLCLSKVHALNRTEIESELNEVNLQFSNLKYNYNQLIDAGNTQDLLDLIQGAWSDDVWELRTELLGQLPYLSQEALYNVALKNLLPPALFLEICLANPDATKSEDFLEKLRTVIPNPIPEYMINLIRASWNQKTLRTAMEEELSALKTYRDEYQTYKTDILLSDSICNYNDIINHLGSRGSFSDYLSMAEIAINQNDYVQANLYLDIYENNNGKLPEEEEAQIESFRDYIAIRESIFLDSTTIYLLDSTQIAALETFASSNNYRGAVLARNILCFLYDICIEDTPNPQKTLRIRANANSLKNATPFIASVKVLPNPANSYASFIWDMKSYDQPAILYIYDQTGKSVMTKEIENTQGQWIWDLKNIPSGVYVFTLKSNQLILYSGKVIVNK